MTKEQSAESELLRFEWNDKHDMWVAYADAAGTGKDPAIGAAGPAGVNALHDEDAYIETCFMTGRVTGMRFGQDHDPHGDKLLRTAFPAQGAWTAREHYNAWEAGERLTFEPKVALTIGRVATRLAYIEASHLLSMWRYGYLSDQPQAQVALLEELQPLLEDLNGAGGLPLSPFDDMPRDTAPLLHDQEYYEELDKQDSASLALFRLATAKPNDYQTEVRQPHDVDLINIDESSKSLLGVSMLTTEQKNNWHIVKAYTIENHDRAPAIWVIAKDDKGRILGASQLNGMQDEATAEIAAMPDADVAQYQFISNPFNRPSNTVYGGRLDHALQISRAAWVAKQIGNTEESERLFGLAAKGWMYLGQTFRAAWAWSLSDRNQTRLDELASISSGTFTGKDIRTVLEAIETIGDVPTTDIVNHRQNPGVVGAQPPAKWMQAVDIQKLLP